MVKIQIDMEENEDRMLELIRAYHQQPGQKIDKRQTIKLLINKYFFGWIPSQGDRAWSQNLLEAVIDKIENNPYWREFRNKNKKGAIINKIQEVFDLDDIQLKKIIEKLEKDNIL